ncbi:LacI family DNA-binding transcriptional regulator [Arthrobacter psychrochitiniphilus]|uniref:LacI family DNA-binding transcriptional regulator n=1 Tax=Arthrobacter psychrochitiniphilus TaxID=291045 RepID=UPI003F7B9BE6
MELGYCLIVKSSHNLDPHVTIHDIAQQAGVSIGAVSFALNGRKGVSDQTRKRIQKIAREMGWAPASAARSLAGAKSETFGLVLARDPQNLGVESFYMGFLAGVEMELAERSYGLLLQVVPSRDAEMITHERWRSTRRVDGLILVDLVVDDPRVAAASSPGALPSVIVGDPSVAGGLTSVWTDDATSMRSAVGYLADLGHRHIAWVSGIELLVHTHIRNEAFKSEMGTRGLEATVIGTDYTPAAGARVTRDILSSASRATAIIYDNDVMAVAALSVALELGLRVPEDVSIVAWDDSTLCAHTYPTLTALSHDVVAFGSHTARRLFDVIDGAEPRAFLDSTPHVMQRGSTGPVPEMRTLS